MMTRWFSFVTPLYKHLAEKNRANWKIFLQQEVEIIDYPDTGNWELNCLQRPQLLYTQATFSSMTGLLDADVVFKAPPLALLKPRTGMDLYIRRTGDPVLSRYFSAGVLLIAPTPVGLALLKRWSDECFENKYQRDIGLREQYALYVAIEHIHPRIDYLEQKYCVAPPRNVTDFVPPKDTIIYHDPASRLLRVQVGKAPPPPPPVTIPAPVVVVVAETKPPDPPPVRVPVKNSRPKKSALVA